jgi:ribonuclease HI
MVRTLDVVTTLSGMTANKTDNNPDNLRRLFASQMEHRWPEYHHIYTDGSTTQSSTSCAVVIPHLNTTIRRKLPYRTSSTKAELTGIREALQFLVRTIGGVNFQLRPRSSRPRPTTNTIHLKSKHRYVVCTDSRASLACVMNPSHKSRCPIDVEQIHHALRSLEKLDVVIGFQWSPSHCGIPGNEKADAEADLAHVNAPLATGIEPSKTEAYQKIKTHIHSQAQRLWDDDKDQHHWLVNKLRPSKLPKLNTRNRLARVKIRRLRVGKALTRTTLFQFKKVDSPLCLTCKVPEDVAHVLLHCTKYDKDRDLLKIQVIDMTLPSVLDPQNSRHLVNFLHDTKLLYSL